MVDLRKLDTLYGRSSNGTIKVWKVYTERYHDGTAKIFTSHGKLGGSMQTSGKEVKGKNIGKANETTPHEQAQLEALSKWKKKVDNNYATSIELIPENRLPMLAHSWKKYGHKMLKTAPFFEHAKLNGVRCLIKRVSETEVTYTSRKGKKFTTLDHLTPYALDHIGIGETFDGELYVHGWTFQQIIRRVKKLREDTNQLQFWCYDIADPLMNQQERDEYLANVFHCVGYCTLMFRYHQPLLIHSEKEMKARHDEYVKVGFEGIILRSRFGEYKFDHRSQDLLKYKEFFDDEFKIYSFKEGEGKDKGCIIFGCLPKNWVGDEITEDDLFWPRPRGTKELRKKWFKEGHKFIGKELTVRYQELSEDGVPIFPVGIAVRDYE